jgi:hypothetical protein
VVLLFTAYVVDTVAGLFELLMPLPLYLANVDAEAVPKALLR